MFRARDGEELRGARRALFDTFPLAGTAYEIAQYQKILVTEILTTERELASERSRERKRHLHLVRIYGDALAHSLLSVYAIRQLARNTGKPAHLSGQGEAFDLPLQCLAVVSERGVPAILADLTNVLKNGDLIVCLDPHLPIIAECKLSAAKDVWFERQGRRGRQLARLESVASFLQKGRGRISGEDKERMTVELTPIPDFDYRIAGQAVASALNHEPKTIVVSEYEVVSSARPGESADTSVLAGWARRSSRLVVGASQDQLIEPWPDMIPPILWGLAADARWGLMEGDVSVTHIVSVDAPVGIELDDVHVVGVVAADDPLHWSYEVLVRGEMVTLGAICLRDVIFNYETIVSAGAQLLESAAKFAATLAASS